MKLEPWKVVSIFVSSTFVDMEAERDYLQRIVIPELNEYFALQRVQLNIIDLRWGVKTNDLNVLEEREKLVLKVCLNEIKRSRPFFIAMLGDRYGWIPSVDRFYSICDALPEKERKLLAYGENKSVTELEIFFGAIKAEIPVSHCLFYYRSEASYQGMDIETASKYRDTFSSLSDEEKEKRIRQLAELKTNIRRFCDANDLRKNINEYTISWNNGHFEGLENWGNIVKEQLRKEIEAELQTQEAVDASEWNWYDDEEKALSAFVSANAQRFEGRKKLISSLKSFALSEDLDTDSRVKILTAFSGAGKSAVMCRLYAELLQESADDTIFLFASAGITPISTSIVHILQRWSLQLCSKLEIEYREEPEVSPGQEPWAERVRKQFLYLATVAQSQELKIVILLDSLDSLLYTSMLAHFTFLPKEATAIITTLPEHLDEYRQLGYEVEDMDLFSVDDATSMIQATCRMNYKDLHQSVLCRLLEKRKKKYFAHSSPLWLSLATQVLFSLDTDDFEAIRKRGEDNNEDKIENYLCGLIDSFPVDAGELFLFLVEKAAAYFGEDLTNLSLQYIASSQNGLREKDLSALLDDKWDELKFASLRRWLGNLMREQGHDKRWNFTHRLLSSVLDQGIGNHRTLSSYLFSLPENDPLRVNELMYHLLKGNDRKGAADYYSRLSGVALIQASEDLAEYMLASEEQKKWVMTMLEQNIGQKTFLQRNLSEGLVRALNSKGELSISSEILKSYLDKIEKKQELEKEEVKEAYKLYKLLIDNGLYEGVVSSISYISRLPLLITQCIRVQDPYLWLLMQQLRIHASLAIGHFENLSKDIVTLFEKSKELYDNGVEKEGTELLYMDAYYCMAQLGRKREDWDNVLANYVHYMKAAVNYIQRVPDNKVFFVQLLEVYSKSARIYLSQKEDVEKAKICANQCVNWASKLYVEEARNIEWIHALSEAYLILGDCALRNGNINEMLEHWNLAFKYYKMVETVTALKFHMLALRNKRSQAALLFMEDYKKGLAAYDKFRFLSLALLAQCVDVELYSLIMEIQEGLLNFYKENQLCGKAYSCINTIAVCLQGMAAMTRQFSKWKERNAQLRNERTELRILRTRERQANGYLHFLTEQSDFPLDEIFNEYADREDLLNIERAVMAIAFLRSDDSHRAEEEFLSLYEQDEIFVPLQILCLKNLLYCLLLHGKRDEFAAIYEDLSNEESRDEDVAQLHRIYDEGGNLPKTGGYCQI